MRPFHPRTSRGVERVQIVGFALVVAIAALVLVAAFSLDGISIGGSSCGGGGAEQACRDVERTLAVGRDLGWFSAAITAAAAALMAAAVLAIVLARLRLALALVVLAVAFAGLVATERVTSRFCPDDYSSGTCGRMDDEWGAILRPPLLDFRVDVRRELVGKPVEPGGPVAEANQTLETFRAGARDGWTLVHRLSVALWFLAVTMLAARFIRPAWAAAVSAVTVGGVSWIVVVDRTHTCAEDSSECYRGFATALALVAAGLVWGIAIAVVALVRSARRRAI